LNKGLCWKCCNELRVDMKCPESCVYSGKKQSENPLPSFKADTYVEMQHALRNYIDLWVGKVQDEFNLMSPLDYAREYKDQMLKWLSGYKYPDYFPFDYLVHKLGIELEPGQVAANPEQVAAEYLRHIIALEYQELRKLTLNQSTLADLEQRYPDLISAIPFLKKVKHFSNIHTGTSEDGSQCIVFVELNYKHEWCLILRLEEGKWYVRQNINGNPSHYFKQNEVYQKIATYLANSEDQKAYFEIAEAMRSYVDSADLFYYRALYWLLVKQVDKAKLDLFNSIALDNGFAPPYMHLGIIYLNEKNYSEAQLWFASMVKLQPDNFDAANNLAIATLASGEKEQALGIWRDILKQKPDYDLARKNLELYG
ncbi:MAG: tetratricopeptide repeat protein, partial [Candidatus Cloacimonetes bacterium]|nr:tetratricopeptide repeat protein [Candidatus Cloacimonadota bacterium]